MLSATKDGITLDSTTSTQEELNKELGIKPEESSATAGEKAVQVETAPVTETGDATESKEEHGEKPKGGYQRRIDKLTKKNSEILEALEAERLARQTLEARLAGKPAEMHTQSQSQSQPIAGLRTEPKETDVDAAGKPKYGDYNSFVKDLAIWQTEKVFAERNQAEAARVDNAELRTIYDAHNQRVIEAVKQSPEMKEAFEEMAESQAPVPEAAGFAIMQLENGPEIVLHLAKNPEVLEKLNALKSDVAVIVEIGRISASLAKSSPAPKTPVSSAPAPITPVTSSAASAAFDPENIDTASYIRGRNAGTIR